MKALSNDIHRNLEVPLSEISSMARAKGIPLAEIRIAVRTGDTPTWNRQQMLRSLHPCWLRHQNRCLF